MKYLLLTLALLTGCSDTGNLQYPQVLDDARAECKVRGGIKMWSPSNPALHAQEYGAGPKVEYTVYCADDVQIHKILHLH